MNGDPGAVISQVMAPHRNEIQKILAEVTGSPDSVVRAEDTYRAGAEASTQASKNLAKTSVWLEGYWKGQAAAAYKKASRGLTQRLDNARGKLDKQAVAMRRVAEAQVKTRMQVEQLLRDFDAQERNLVALCRGYPQLAQGTIAQAQVVAAAFAQQAAAAKVAFAELLLEVANELDPKAPTQYNEHHWGPKPGETIVLSAAQRAVLDKLGDEYYRRTGKGLTVTSGTRTTAEQAEAMYQKIVNPDPRYKNDPLGEYNRRLGDLIMKAYRDHVAEGPAAAKQAMEKEIVRQIEQDKAYVSDHLRAGALDIRSNDMTNADRKEFVAAAKATGAFDKPPHSESFGGGPHWHLEINKENLVPPQPQPTNAAGGTLFGAID